MPFRVGWLVSELPGSTSPCQTKMGFLVDVATPRLLHGCRGFKLRISGLHSTHSYPLHSLPSPALLILLIYFPHYSSAPLKQLVQFLTLPRMKDQSSCQESILLQRNKQQLQICIRLELFWNCSKFLTLTFNFPIYLSQALLLVLFHFTTAWLLLSSSLTEERQGTKDQDKGPGSLEHLHLNWQACVTPVLTPTQVLREKALGADETHVPKNQEQELGCLHLLLGPALLHVHGQRAHASLFPRKPSHLTGSVCF